MSYDRIKKRNRSAEQGMYKSYVKRIGEFYDEILLDQAGRFTIPIQQVDATLPPTELAKRLKEFCSIVNPAGPVQDKPLLLEPAYNRNIDWQPSWGNCKSINISTINILTVNILIVNIINYQHINRHHINH